MGAEERPNVEGAPEGPRYELASAAWLGMVHAVFRARLTAALRRQRPLCDFSLSEAFTDAPRHIGQGRDLVGWTCEFRGGVFAFRNEPAPLADYRMIGCYERLLELVRFRIGDDAERRARYAAMGADLYQAGDVRIAGHAPKLPAEFDAVHDLVAAFTA